MQELEVRVEVNYESVDDFLTETVTKGIRGNASIYEIWIFIVKIWNSSKYDALMK